MKVVTFFLSLLIFFACKNNYSSPNTENSSFIEKTQIERTNLNKDLESYLGSYTSIDSLNDIYFIKNINDSLFLTQYYYGHYERIGHITWNENNNIKNVRRFLINNLQGASVPTYELFTEQDHLYLKIDTYDAITDQNVIRTYQYATEVHNLRGDSLVKKFLSQQIYNKAFEKFSESQRQYDFAEIDLNDDGQFEYLISLFNLDYCGSGGCTLWIINDQGEKISKTTQVNMPLTISQHSSNGWYDIICYSNGHHRILTFDGQEYSNNASIQDTISEVERYNLNRVTLLKRFM